MEGRTLMCFCNVETDVRDWITLQFVDEGDDVRCDNVDRDNTRQTLN